MIRIRLFKSFQVFFLGFVGACLHLNVATAQTGVTCTDDVVTNFSASSIVKVDHAPMMHEGEMSEILPPDLLTESSKEAIAWAPDWLRDDLLDNLEQLDAVHQDLYAGMILNPSELRFTDEIAFCIAQIAPEILQHENFRSELIEENVFYLYEHDVYLDYVRIVDDGTPGIDSDYFSTTAYYVEEAGLKTEYVLEKSYYYWLIVHPKIEDEMADYCDPDQPMGPHADPPTGVFWRDWIFTYTEPKPESREDYPVLKNQMAGVDVLWKSKVNDLDNGAIGVITQWILDVLDFGSGSERPIQPVRIYKLHLGRCGEHQDFTSAASRACLIPCLNSQAIGEDHVWNEFFDRRLIHWEPVNVYIDSPFTYEDGWGKLFSAVMDIYGDGFGVDVIDSYSHNFCTIDARVEDANHDPIDGAKFLFKKGAGMIGLWDYTGSDGHSMLRYGDGIKLKGRVITGIGEYPDDFVEISPATEDGETYTWTATLDETLPLIPATEDPSAEINTNFRIDFEYAISGEVRQGSYQYDGKNTYTRRSPGGSIDVFIVDQSNYNLYTQSQPFNVEWASWFSSSGASSFEIPRSDSWFVVFSAERKLKCKQLLDVTISLMENIDETWTTASTISRSIGVKPGERYTVGTQITPALGVRLEMPSHTFHPGDACDLMAYIGNPGDIQNDVPLFVILDVQGLYFFWPEWVMSPQFSYQPVDLNYGETQLDIIPHFEWPAIDGTMTGLKFYGAMTNQEMTQISGAMDIWEFGWTDQQ